MARYRQGNRDVAFKINRKRTLISSHIPASRKKHADILCVLARARPRLVKAMIAGADASLLKALSECSKNILKGYVSLTPYQKKRLQGYKTALRTLARRKTSTVRRRALLQKGGFVGTILAAIAPLVIEGISHLATVLSKKKKKTYNKH